jgi:hypothetical protein
MPLLLKELVLSDPTKAQSVVPAKYQQIILEVNTLLTKDPPVLWPH